jgi:hypothetical protein
MQLGPRFALFARSSQQVFQRLAHCIVVCFGFIRARHIDDDDDDDDDDATML